MENITVNGVQYVKKNGVKKELVISDKQNELPFETGKAYLIRTVTYFALGRVTEIVGKFIKLEEASWVADTGRFHKAITNGELSEVEPVGEMCVNSDSIVDAFPWKHKLPNKVK